MIAVFAGKSVLVCGGVGGGLAVPSDGVVARREGSRHRFVLDHDDHPHADLVVAAQQGGAGDVSRAAFPFSFGRRGVAGAFVPGLFGAAAGSGG